IEVRPGIGTLVAELPEASASKRSQLLGTEIEQLVVEAKKLGMNLDEVLAALSQHWARLDSGNQQLALEPIEGGARKP
ncbi:MAG: GntR family transcriptional regulator, partial [Blastocatellia bacterium]